jgi:hypothetical protein
MAGAAAPPLALAAPRAWRIAVDGATVAFGTTVAQPPGTAAPRFVTHGWAAEGAVRPLRDPCAALCAEVLRLVFARLSVRERLTCARVCTAWRAELRPGCRGASSDDAAAVVWATIDLSVDALPAPPLHALLASPALARYGPHVRALRLRGTGVMDEELRAAAAACPRLSLLDVRDCEDAFRYDCYVENHDEDSDDSDEEEETVRPPYGLMELLLELYARTRPGEHFTLLFDHAGHETCLACDDFCDDAANAVSGALVCASAWPVKGAKDEDAVIGDAGDGPWLRCDLAACPMREKAAFEAGCIKLMPVVVRGQPREEDAATWTYMCEACGTSTCEGCTVQHACVGGARRVLCVECAPRSRAQCAACDGTPCTRCCVARCMLATAGGGCTQRLCETCVTTARPPLLARCDDCGAVACTLHTRACVTCASGRVGVERAAADDLDACFRAMFRCCGCRRTYCFSCDPGPQGGQAGHAVRECTLREELRADSGCCFCVSWPRFCGGRAAAVLGVCVQEAAVATEDAQEADMLAEAHREEAAKAQAALEAALDAAACASAECARAAASAADAARRQAVAQAQLARAREDIVA